MTIPEIIQECKKVAVVGSMGYSDMNHFSAWIKYYTQNMQKICFISGGAKSGADNLIELYAESNSNNLLIHYPKYHQYGTRAPLERNKLIVGSADILITFWDGFSTGTAHTISLAKQKGIPIRIVNI